jgi:hypothetical protein
MSSSRPSGIYATMAWWENSSYMAFKRISGVAKMSTVENE